MIAKVMRDGHLFSDGTNVMCTTASEASVDLENRFSRVPLGELAMHEFLLNKAARLETFLWTIRMFEPCGLFFSGFESAGREEIAETQSETPKECLSVRNRNVERKT